MRERLLFVLLCLAAFVQCSPKTEAGKNKPNILFIAVDDLRPELASYGRDYIKSPNLDQLASEGVLFNRHYVAVPTCGASRHSLLTGRLPDSRSDIRNSASVESLSEKPESVEPETFMHHLKRNGYYTVGIGKISHHPDGHVYGYTDSVSNIMELPYSWDEMVLNTDKWGTGHNAFFGYADGSNRNTLNGMVKPYESATVNDEGYPDGLIAKTAIEKLGVLSKKDQPFLLAIGFFKPHLPFNAPKKYWDLYERSEIPVSPNPFLPENVHKSSLQTMGEFHNYKLGDEYATLDEPVSEVYAKKLGHGYAACVSYIDAQIGKVLEELDNLGLDNNTVVVIWGDHGWHLGDHRIWGKHTLLERSLHSTLIIRIPGAQDSKIVNKIVSSIDIYPTLMDLTALEMPYETQGRSLMPLIQNPENEDWIEVAYSYFRNGISVRVPGYRMNKYFREEQPVIELFDHHADPYETRNVADERQDIVERLVPIWEKGNTGIYNEDVSN